MIYIIFCLFIWSVGGATVDWEAAIEMIEHFRFREELLKKDNDQIQENIIITRDYMKPAEQRLRVFKTVRKGLTDGSVEYEGEPLMTSELFDIFYPIMQSQDENSSVKDSDLVKVLRDHISNIEPKRAAALLDSLINEELKLVKSQRAEIDNHEKRIKDICKELVFNEREIVSATANALIIIRQRVRYLEDELKFYPTDFHLLEELQDGKNALKSLTASLNATANFLNRTRSFSPKYTTLLTRKINE
jgi:hypothetical protein